MVYFFLVEILLESFIVVIDYTHGRILQIDLQNGTVVKLPISINRAPGLVLDKSTMTLFYAEASSNTITSTTLHGQNSTLFYATGKYKHLYFAHAFLVKKLLVILFMQRYLIKYIFQFFQDFVSLVLFF